MYIPQPYADDYFQNQTGGTTGLPMAAAVPGATANQSLLTGNATAAAPAVLTAAVPTAGVVAAVPAGGAVQPADVSVPAIVPSTGTGGAVAPVAGVQVKFCRI